MTRTMEMAMAMAVAIMMMPLMAMLYQIEKPSKQINKNLPKQTLSADKLKHCKHNKKPTNTEKGKAKAKEK